ncbi:hypothetical protein FISHEDRAFT_74869 [Fistulina hepatica ATCC 64428]|uniref:Uncharacterized protein n=1 Tax=Fistulina hepatica ATCC 64428 TaxID=1128425 RepID=A0A0D7A910_9AGAR|nr:hypothetical protein FISHEDRAFT_74869 [Fistulina hepatica ATCC 64428]
MAHQLKKKKRIMKDSDDESDIKQPPSTTAGKAVRWHSLVASSDMMAHCAHARNGRFVMPSEISLNSDNSFNTKDGPCVKQLDDDDNTNDINDSAMEADGNSLPPDFHLESLPSSVYAKLCSKSWPPHPATFACPQSAACACPELLTFTCLKPLVFMCPKPLVFACPELLTVACPELLAITCPKLPTITCSEPYCQLTAIMCH